MEVNTDSAANPQSREEHGAASEPPLNARLPPPMLDTSIAVDLASEDTTPVPHSAPNGAVTTPRRPSNTAAGMKHGDSPGGKTLRRSSSAVSLGGGSSPRLSRKGSRSSLGGPSEKGDNRPTPKRSISNMISGLRDSQSTMEAIEEPVPLTAAGIATEHFRRELDHHSQPDTRAKAVVILHDACYGHRWSRLKTNKSTLSMIVERPERLQASVLGASTAYVRLGEHHAAAKNAPHPDKIAPSAPPFKIQRTRRNMDITSPFVTNVHGTEWMSELRHLCDQAEERLAAGTSELTRASQMGQPDKTPLHPGDLYLAAESLQAFQGALGGVAEAVDAVFDPTSATTRAFVAVRPPGHHCSADHPSGFCWLNNVHVGIEYAAQIYGLTHAVIFDFDLHHGDGSQQITWERNSQNNIKRENAKPNSKLKLNPDIGYYSIHDINSYPCEMGDDAKVQAASLCIENAHGQNIWNVHLQPYKNEDEFWQLYETRYRVLLAKAKTFLEQQNARLKQENKVRSKAAIFISAGFDASEWEGAGMQRHNVSVPTEFYARFTRDVVELAQAKDSACDGRVISVLEGGYSDRAICSGVLSHLSGLCTAPVESKSALNGSQDVGLDQLMRGLQLNQAVKEELFYDKTWWSAANLSALENKINPPPPPQAKKGRTGPQPTYATPTESFAYKVVDTDKFARSISGTMREAPKIARPPTPPPPEVNWIVATQELSKLLIPADRQTRSHTAEELGGVKVKKEKIAAPAPLPEGMKGRQLRDRAKGKAPGPYPESTHSDEVESVRSVSRSSNRRQTMHELPSATAPAVNTHRRASRRLSVASTLSSGTNSMDIDTPPVPPLPASSRNSDVASRPQTNTSSSTQSVDVKKTRAPPKLNKPTSNTGPGSQGSAPGLKKAAPGKPAQAANAVPRAPVAASNGDMDKLANGLKKVTIKVGSREEHDRKQKEKEAAERRARALKGAETRRLNAAAKKAAQGSAAATPTTSSPPLPAQAQLGQQPQAIAQPLHSPMMEAETFDSISVRGPVPIQPTEPAQLASVPQEPSTFEPTVPPQMPPPLVHNHPVFLAPQAPQVVQPTPATQIMPTPQSDTTRPTSNGSASSPPRFKSPNKSQLPVWSSTGVIPFAATAASAPPSPAKQPAPSTAPRISLPSSEQTNGQNGDNTGSASDSIWDVPLTPQR